MAIVIKGIEDFVTTSLHKKTVTMKGGGEGKIA
jgi:hypothetical protein